MYGVTPQPYPVTFRAFVEDRPGPAWLEHFNRHWPALRSVLKSLEPAELSPLSVAEKALRVTMPELVPVWERLVDLAGGDPLAARVLTLADNPPPVDGCSQGVVDGLLVRNYEFNPDQFEATIWASALTGRHVIGVTAGLWGLLDGINDAGLAISAAFGGQRLHGPGFSVPLIVRYLLEVCDDLDEVAERLPRLPSTEAQNLTVVDASGASASYFLTPGQPPRRSLETVVTNHQEQVTWSEHAEFSRTVERQRTLRALVETSDVDSVTAAMLRPPLYCTDYMRSFGTLYTAVYRPRERAAEYHWPGEVWPQSFEAFSPGERRVWYTPELPVQARDPQA